MKSAGFVIFPQDFLMGVRHLNTEEVGAYLLLLFEQWETGFIENSPVFLKKISKISPKKLQKVLKKFKENEQGLYNERLEVERSKQFKFSELQAEKAKARWNKEHAAALIGHKSGICPSDASHSHTPIKKYTPLPPEGELSNGFEEFWILYDKKVDRKKTEATWAKLKASEREAIMVHLPLYKISQPDRQYRKNPYSFLYNRSWENEIVQKLNSVQDGSRDDKAEYLKLRQKREERTRQLGAGLI